MNSVQMRKRIEQLFEYRRDTGEFVRKSTVANQRAGKVAGTLDSHGYVQIKIDRRLYLAHRLAWLLESGDWPQADIDHINGERTDNRIANLRQVSRSVNSQNRRKPCADNRTGFLGVSKSPYGFVAQIWLDGRTVNLGTHATPELAHAAYVAAKRLGHVGCTI